MKLISESIEDVDYLIEDDDAGKKNYKIKGPFLQAEIKNRNGRIYPLNILEKEVNRYNKEYIQKNRAFGELGHPDGPTVNLERVSHLITKLYPDGNNFIGEAKVMDTPDAPAADIVADPAAPNAFVEGIMEGKEWVWDNGAVKEMDIENYKKELDRKYKFAQAREEKAAEMFEDFM